MKSKPNIILIVMDTVRADHLSCYGYHRKTSPNIDKLAEQGVLYEKAFTTAEWSPPSHASIFTGKYPSYHRVLGKNLLLNNENTTIAEILAHHGYQTICVTRNDLIGYETNLSKGFQEYILSLPTKSYKFILPNLKNLFKTMIYGRDQNTYLTLEIVKKVLKNQRRSNKPFFLFINFLNCHARYDPPRPFKERFCNGFKESKLYLIDFFLMKTFGRTTEKINDSNLDIQKIRYAATNYGQFSFMSGDLDISNKEWDIIKSWYDGEISYLDHHIGQFITFLNEEDLLNDTLLIITSDHGENFGEHGLASHHFCLYDSLLHVPLILIYPDLIPKRKRISNIVSLVSIFPTILDLLNIKGYRNNIQGKSLAPFENREIYDFICAECGKSVSAANVGKNSPLQKFRDKIQKFDVGFKCIRTEEYKYILSSNGKEELYNLQDDPYERVNLASKYPEKVKYLRDLLEKTLDISFFGSEEFPNNKYRKEIIGRLKSLGYI